MALSPHLLGAGLVAFCIWVISAQSSLPNVAGHRLSSGFDGRSPQHRIANIDRLTSDNIPSDTRLHWMQYTTQVLVMAASTCPFIPFATVIVNHTDTKGQGDLICTGTNSGPSTGNPILHGETAAITNCTNILLDPNGRFKLTPSEARAAFTDFTLYTNAESCPMCAAAIRWAGLREYVYGTSIEALTKFGWRQIQIPSLELFDRSLDLQSPLPSTIGEVDPGATDPLFRWQFDSSVHCPPGCSRSENGATCIKA
ncbi:cytidine deaminase-like protein [Aspergillus oleicola]